MTDQHGGAYPAPDSPPGPPGPAVNPSHPAAGYPMGYGAPGQQPPPAGQPSGPYGYPPAPYGAGYPMPGYMPGPTAKSPALMLLASFFIPGLGTILNGETGKGVAILITHFCCIVFGVLLLAVLIGVPFLLAAFGIWVWGLVDAYRGAERWNLAHGLRNPL